MLHKKVSFKVKRINSTSATVYKNVQLQWVGCVEKNGIWKHFNNHINEAQLTAESHPGQLSPLFHVHSAFWAVVCLCSQHWEVVAIWMFHTCTQTSVCLCVSTWSWSAWCELQLLRGLMRWTGESRAPSDARSGLLRLILLLSASTRSVRVQQGSATFKSTSRWYWGSV